MEINKNLTKIQKHILFEKGTERPYEENHDELNNVGKYVCVNCENELFDSKSRFICGCGWHAFDSKLSGSIDELIDQNDLKHPDRKHNPRTEVICSHCNGHLGHKFIGEGHTSTNVRYCINGSIIKFIKQ